MPIAFLALQKRNRPNFFGAKNGKKREGFVKKREKIEKNEKFRP